MKAWIAPLVATGLVMAMAMAGCGGGGQSGGASPSAKSGGTLTTAIGIDPDTLDPAANTTTTAGQIVDMMAEPLVKIDQNGAVQPDLALSWSPSPDGKAYTFTLRSGVKFSDGTAFNASAVKFSLDRIISPSTYKAQAGILGGATGIDHVDVVDDTHVRVALKSSLASFVAAMTQTVADIISPASVSVSGNTLQKIAVPVGTGPYKLSERVAGDHITVVKNDSYWGTRANYSTQILKVVPEAASREALIKSNGADVIMLPPVSDLPALQTSSSLKVIMGPSDRLVDIIINTEDRTQALLNNPEVRQALNYAVDKNAIIKNVMFNMATGLDAPMAKTLFGYCSAGSYTYNPQKARQMLAAAGASGMKVKLVSPTGRYIQDIQVANAVAGYLRNAGLNVTGPTTNDWPAYVATYVTVPPASATTDLSVLGWAPAFMDASQALEQFYSPRIPPSGQASSYYTNPQVDSWISAGNTSTDSNTRKTNYCNAQKQIWNDAPWVFLYNQKNPFVTTSKVTGIYGLPNEKFVTTWASPA